MRSRSLVTAAAACSVLLTAAARGPASVPATQSVSIDARCAGNRNTSITVQPWNLHVGQGDEVQWVISPSANTGEVTISPKAAWPFANNRRQGSKTVPASSSGMQPGARGRYSYTIRLVCQAGASQPDTVVVDPDVIVD